MAVHEIGRWTIGIDEVGRGALAGPVVVVAVMIEGGGWKRKGDIKKLGTLKDSKKLSAKQREAWCEYFASHPKITFAIARVYPREIEKRNISQAANLAAKRALARLVKNRDTKIFLDGGLYLGNRKHQAAKFPNAKTIIKADETIPAVSIASIIAKVHRDRFMAKLGKKYPQYGFATHKGYGTKIHREAITKIGSCDVHRLTFLTKSYNISK
jgi:ribonuclease HII